MNIVRFLIGWLFVSMILIFSNTTPLSVNWWCVCAGTLGAMLVWAL
jgi:uncharacterized membrane protein YdcZ (DUF606 family)